MASSEQPAVHAVSSTRAGEAATALPTVRLLLTAVIAAIATAVAWAAATTATGRGELVKEGAAGPAVVAIVTMASLLVMRPWKARAVGAWAGPWLGGLLLRLLLTPLLAWLLYSAAPLSLAPLMVAVAVAYVIMQVSEAAVVAFYLKRVI